MLEVEDSGLGMRPEVKARVFEPFFTTKPRGQGTGLGLSSVHGIVVQSGGAVLVDSAPGEGTRVRIFLPHEDRVSAEAAVPERASPAAVGHAGPARILFVEDEQHVRALGVRVLMRAGHEVVEAANAEEALALFEKAGDFDLVCTDVVMPGLSGPELVSRLRALRGRSTPPVLFMSGYFKQAIEEADELLLEGLLLQKPFTPDQLLSAVDGLLAERSQPA
jgi:two-component system cell cycle sensor histidine kinase/response regulator CckA